MKIDQVPGPADAALDNGPAFNRFKLTFVEERSNLEDTAGPPLAFVTVTHVDPRGLTLDGDPKLAAEAGCCPFPHIFFLSVRHIVVQSVATRSNLPPRP